MPLKSLQQILIMDYRKPSGARPSSVVDEFIVFGDISAKTTESAEAALPSSRTLFIEGVCLDQGDVPCCVAVALSTAMQFVGRTAPLSPLFNYFLSRNNANVLDDVEPFNAFRSAKMDGVCVASLHAATFDEPSARIEPSAAAKADALLRRLRPTALGRPRAGQIAVNEAAWKSSIARSLPVVAAFFMSPEYDAIRNGTTIDHAAPTVVGGFGHACVVIGYDDAQSHFIMRDSRGPNIGIAGTWHLPYDRLAEGFIFESWAIVEVP